MLLTIYLHGIYQNSRPKSSLGEELRRKALAAAGSGDLGHAGVGFRKTLGL
jgi:hypothetical protein